MTKGRGGFFALVACLVVGFGFYEWLLYARWRVLAEWGALGSALGPIAAVFSAAAVFAALRSIDLQRAVLAGQQEELARQQEQIDRHMKLLEEQRKQFARSAEAQENLADAQMETVSLEQEALLERKAAHETAKLAVTAQTNANREAAAMRLAQHSNTIGILQGALASLDALETEVRTRGRWEAHSELIEGRRKMLNDRLKLEHRSESQLETLISTGKSG